MIVSNNFFIAISEMTIFPFRKSVLHFVASTPFGFRTQKFRRSISNSRIYYQQSTSSSKATATVGGAVFDRKTKRLQRNRAAALDDYETYEYLKKEIGYRVADRIYDIKRFFNLVVDLGCGTGHIAPHVFKENVGCLIQVDLSNGMVQKARQSEEVPTCSVIADEELTLFRPESVDLFVSSLSMHWINDLPGFFKRTYDALIPDGAIVGAMLGGETLYQLRCSLQLAELERRGGLAPHISPFTEIRDIGALMNRAGFKLLTIDVDEIEVSYPSIFHLMSDLQDMAENGAAVRRAKHLQRDVQYAAAAIYQEMYGKENGVCPATFQFIYFIGWKPGATTPQAAKRGSATVSLKDLGKIIEQPK